MFKKIGLITVLVIGGIVLTNTALVGMGWKKAKSFIQKQIPPESKLESIRDEVNDLHKEMKKQIAEVAKETVKVQNLQEEVQLAEANQKRLFDRVLTLKKDLEKDEKYYVYDDVKYSAERLQNKLNRDWDSYKRGQEKLVILKKSLEARETSLTAARERLMDMRGKKEELELMVAQLEADLKNVRLAQSRSDFNFDDSKIGEIQKSIAEVRTWIREQQVAGEIEGKFTSDAIPVEKKSAASSDVMKEIEDAAAKASKPTNRAEN